MRPGTAVRASGPLGSFTLSDHPAAKYLFLTAGSGVTPLISTARTLHDLAADTDLVSVHSARSPRDVLFRAELQLIARDLPGFTALHVCTDDDPTEAWHGYRGRLTPDSLRAAVPDLLDREIFCCGPPGYLAAVRTMLGELGCDPAHCHEESFDLGAAEPQPAAAPAQAHPTGFRVEFSASGSVVTCPPGATVLDAAEEAGVPVPTSCRQGLCGTCKTTLTSGRVEMDHKGGIREREIAQGKVLLCCARPLTDLVIDR
jgi:ferredoxin-NADP reductase